MDYLVETRNNGAHCVFMGPSSATKPTSGFKSGVWVESDTGDTYFFTGSEWVKQFSFQA